MLNVNKKFLLGGLACLVVIAVLGHWLFPLTPAALTDLMSRLGLSAAPVSHQFADHRAWLGLPNVMDVLSNLPFLLLGAWGAGILLAREGSCSSMCPPMWRTLMLTFAGLAFTAAGSGWYHLDPNTSGLIWDRLGMVVVFAGVLGLILGEKFDPGISWAVALGSMAAGAVSLWLWVSTHDLLAWALYQFGGFALVIALAACRSLPQSMGIRFGWLVLAYVIAKLCEIGDHAIWHFTNEIISGHTLKHLAASLAVQPILCAISRRA